MFNPDLYTHLHFSFASSLPPFFSHSFFLSIKSDITHVCEIKTAAAPEGTQSKRGTAHELPSLVYTYTYSFLTQSCGEQVSVCTYNFTPLDGIRIFVPQKAIPDIKCF